MSPEALSSIRRMVLVSIVSSRRAMKVSLSSPGSIGGRNSETPVLPMYLFLSRSRPDYTKRHGNRGNLDVQVVVNVPNTTAITFFRAKCHERAFGVNHDGAICIVRFSSAVDHLLGSILRDGKIDNYKPKFADDAAEERCFFKCLHRRCGQALSVSQPFRGLHPLL